ncbi:GL14792 [Drosophila persimilis]|uniref:GL14792 n=1 Tax=Drosophila persimilis TaxID=7234 RepID=B4HCJ0_DROPE|nr:GL14792 [Drosophila persimilis]
MEIIAPLDNALLNQGNQHTFSRGGIGSVIDLTFVSSSLFNSLGWSISKAISWDIGQQTSSVETAAPRWRYYRADTLNTALFTELMSNLTANGNAGASGGSMHCHHGSEEALRSPPPTCVLVERGHCRVTPGMQPSSTPLPALARKPCLSAMAIHVQGLQKGSQGGH